MTAELQKLEARVSELEGEGIK